MKIDLTTGEVVTEGYSDTRKSPLPAFVMLFQSALLAAVADETLRGESLRVLCYIAAKTKPGNQCAVTSQADIGRDLTMSQQSVARGMKQLFERGLLVRGIRIGRGHAYQLNPHFAWRGTGDAHARVVPTAPPLKLAHKRT